MRLLSYSVGGKESWGAVKDDGVVDLGARLKSRFTGLRDAIARDGLPVLRDETARATADVALSAIRYRIPVPDPEKILCIGVNYNDRNAEYKDGSEAAKYPSMFFRTRESLVGHNEPILRPPESNQLDYEGEIALVIGKGGRRIPKAEAATHIFGLSCFQEGTIRDWTRHSKFNVTQGKNFDASGSMGPFLVTADEIADYTNLTVSTFVNGERRQHDSTANLMFGFADLIAYVSTFTTLRPGDVISTGTPTGAGVRFSPPIWLKPGDEVTVEAAGIGRLSNKIEDEK
ncbi:MAG TPA: fumarylacetoacetate hydrolase family protein [Stellaceae bacterium]|nr:fumarylacetoacetate hydrolase family protein [Stellaceae bacterium]